MRSIAERYKQFNVTTFHEYYPFADQVNDQYACAEFILHLYFEFCFRRWK